VVREKVSIWSNDVLGDDSLPRTESMIALRISSVLTVPLVVLDCVMGAIYLHTGQLAVQFDKEHLELLTGFAAIVAGPLHNALHIDQLEREKRLLQDEIAVDHRMVGDGARMQQVYEFIPKVAESDSTVLIGGESGTGKELVARAIHRNSRRKEKPFIAVNCAALTESLLESEMFGHEKGAFTGAMNQKKGPDRGSCGRHPVLG
jgi:Nif-specific regulatory protein